MIKIPHSKHITAKQSTITPSPNHSHRGSINFNTINALMPNIVLQNVMPNSLILSGINSAVTISEADEAAID